MRPSLVLLLCIALALPFGVFAQTPAPAPAPTPETTYAAVFMRLALGSLSRLQPCVEGRREQLEVVKDRIRGVRVTITPEGRVGEVVATPRNAMPPEAMACFLAVIRTWSVPAPENGRPLRLRFTRRHFFPG